MKNYFDMHRLHPKLVFEMKLFNLTTQTSLKDMSSLGKREREKG